MPETEKASKPPKQIYLDSSDISSFSDTSRMQSQELQETWAFLLSHINKGTIQVRYSFVHITEITQLDHRYRNAALQRASILNRLCQGQVLLSRDQVLRTELRIASGLDGNAFPNYAYGTHDQWMPAIEDRIANLKQIAVQKLEEILQSVTRQQRRILRKRLFTRQGLSERGIRELAKANAPLTTAFEAEFPLTERFWKDDMFSLYLMGKISESELVSELMMGFGNPENFIGWIVDKHDRNLKIPGWLRRQGQSHIEFMERMREKVEGFQRAGLGDIQSELSAILDTREIRTGLIKRELEEIDTEVGMTLNEQDVDKLAPVPILDCFLHAARLHAIANMKGRRRKLLVSDMGDIMHCMYIPYVDIFRSDAYGATVFRPLEVEYGTRIVDKLKQLPEVIEAVL